MTHILMKLKFTTKLDIPGSLEINRLDVNVTMPELFINAYSFRGPIATRYFLHIRTYKFMNPHYYRV